MDDKISKLIELQKVGLALRSLEQERQQGPIRLLALEEVFAETSATVGAVKHRHDALREEGRQLELELKELQDKLAKFQAALMVVKNTREYSAVLKEIDQAKIEITRRDEGILQRMQEMETLQSDLPEVEAKLAVEAEAFEKEKAEIVAAMETLDRRRGELEGDRRRIETGLPANVVASFYRVADARQGIAMARVAEAICSACNVRLRPHVLQEVRRGENLLTCDSCRRFLYFEVVAEGSSSAASGAA